MLTKLLKTLVVISFFLLSSVAYSQDRFRMDYSYMTPQIDFIWQQTVETKSIFVFNTNESKDIIQYWESGKKSVYSLIGSFELVPATDGVPEYSSATVVDDEGAEITIKVFDVEGVYMLFSEGNCIQFHN